MKRKAVSVDRVKTLFRTLPIFESLPEPSLDRLVRSGKLERIGENQTLFKTGDPSDRLHVILEGAIEILREAPGRADPAPTAYLTPGEVIGGLALLTSTPRRCIGRVPESLVVWTMARGPFEAFARSTPGYWQQFARALARRLEALVTDDSGLADPRDLSGRLEYFDLPTVVQTLASSRQTGILSLVDDDASPLADVMLLDGRVERARCGDLEGEDAFLWILTSGLTGQFTFRNMPAVTPETVGGSRVLPSTMELLVEAARRMDENRESGEPT